MSRNSALGTVTLALAAAIALTEAASAADVYLQGATAPTGGIWVNDVVGPAGGHLWVSDHLQGFCRLNPTSAANTSATLQITGCIIADGQPAFDRARNLAYVPDGSAKSIGVARVKLNASTALFNGGRTNLSGNLPVQQKACKNNNLAGCRPTAVALSPDGRDLYIATKRSGGDIYRIRNAYNGSPGIAGAPSAVQLVGGSSDGGPVLGLAFIGNDLYLAESAAVTRIADPSNLDTTDGLGLCNNNNVCAAEDVGLGFLAPLALGSDGTNLFVSDAGSANPVTVINPQTFAAVTIPEFFVNVSGFAYAPAAVDPVTGATTRVARLFWADDATAGAAVGQGHWYSTEAANVTP